MKKQTKFLTAAEAAAALSGRAPKPLKWKKHGEIRYNSDGTIDEVVVNGCDFHLEQMDDGHWWIGIYAGRRRKPRKGCKYGQKDTLHVNLLTKKNINIKCIVDDCCY